MPLIHHHRAFIVHTPSGELRVHPCPVLMNRIGQFCVLRNRAFVPGTAAHVKGAFGVWISALLLGDHEPDAAFCALTVKSDMPFAQDVVFRIVRGHRGHHDPVLDRDAANPKRRPNVAIGGTLLAHAVFLAARDRGLSLLKTWSADFTRASAWEESRGVTRRTSHPH